MNLEQEIKNAIGLDSPQLQPEPKPEPKPEITIHDFGQLLAEHEPIKKQK